jgi:hypothetical protein
MVSWCRRPKSPLYLTATPSNTWMQIRNWECKDRRKDNEIIGDNRLEWGKKAEESSWYENGGDDLHSFFPCLDFRFANVYDMSRY